jgi:POT family proton-dependent oligopeptide transporter
MASEPATTAIEARSSTRGDLFGHPRGLSYLFATEMWERFSYYGMRSLLVLYMVKYLFDPGRAQTVIGLASLKAFMESIFGPLDIQPFSSQVYGFYTGLVYLTPVLGGYLADRVLGQRRMVVIGAGLMAIGHFMMAFEPLFLFALALLILGNGAFKPNISTQVGALYAPGDPRRDRAFSIFYVGINLGAFLAPLVCGTLGEKLGWHYGFAAAGVGMTLGLAIYLYASRHLPMDKWQERMRLTDEQPLGGDEWRALGALIVLALPVTFFWATYEQVGNTVTLWADGHTDRSLGLFGFTIPTTWFLALNPFLIFAFTPLILALWKRQADTGREPSTVAKMAYGCLMNAAAYLILCATAFLTGDAKASWLWLIAYFMVLTVGELYLSPTSLSLVTKVAPARVISMMMGVWLATSFTGGFLAGYLGSLWSGMDKDRFFLMLAIVSGLAGLVVLAFVRPLKPMLRES